MTRPPVRPADAESSEAASRPLGSRCGLAAGGRPGAPLTRGPALAAALALLVGLVAGSARAEMPFPACEPPGCTDPRDFASFLFLPRGVLPDDFFFFPDAPELGSGWKYAASLEADGTPGPGLNVTAAWQVSTGRPDVMVAVLDSGIRWREAELVRKVALHTGELPPPCPGGLAGGFDCDANGVVEARDFADAPCANGPVVDANATGRIDAQDVIAACSDGVDDDGNGYVDDIAGWDFLDDDNDPFDDTDFGHGTGEGEDMVAEADNGGGFPGVAPSAMFVPVRVADSFIGVDADFVRGVVYAVERGVDVISEALGTLGGSRLTQAAIDLAWLRGIPVVASAADEQSRHHNWPAVADHVIWVNSIRNGDGDVVADRRDFRILNGCTNHGGKAWVAISSTGCSSEATGRAAGIAALLLSHGRNLLDQGDLEPYPGTDRPYSAEEVRQIFRAAARDVDRSGDPPLAPGPVGGLLQLALSGPTPETAFRAATRFPAGPGWDQYTGYGRPDVLRMLEIATDAIPPEADLASRDLAWFDIVDPRRRRVVPVQGHAAAVRTPGAWRWSLEVGCGVEPASFEGLGSGERSARRRVPVAALWHPADTAARCGFDQGAPIEDPLAHSVTLRLRVVDAEGRLGEDRRTVAIHSDPTQRFVRDLGAAGESSPTLADVDRDGVLDIVYAAADGLVHVLDGRRGREVWGFPARTDPMVPRERIRAVATWREGRVPVPREPLLAAPAVDDLDGDGRVEIVVASTEGRVYVFDDHGRLRPGFPVSSDPRLSTRERTDAINDVDPGFVASPVLVDLDAPAAASTAPRRPRQGRFGRVRFTHGGAGDLEILAAGLDGHVYAWRADGTPVAGFPARLGDRERLAEDPDTGRWAPRDGGVRDRLAKILSSPAVGDLDGDGAPEIVVATNEEYRDGAGLFSTEGSGLLELLVGAGGDLGGFSVETAGRLYALDAEGRILPDWPVPTPLLAPGLLPTVATGTPGSPALARLEADGDLVAAVSAAVGPAMLFRGDGSLFLGEGGAGAPRALALDFPAPGFPAIPAAADLNDPATFSFDAPFFPALGSGAFGDLTGDGLPEYAAPTGGVRKLLDAATPGRQAFGDHQIAAWNPRDGSLLPQFPRRMDDMQFLTPPALADVDGDGRADVVQGSGVYLLRAYTEEGRTPAGWPKFTHGWLVGTPAVGDVDGDDRVEVVAVTREGRLFAWDTPAAARAEALPWPSFGRDRRNTRNLDSEVSPLAPERSFFERLLWILEAFFLFFFQLLEAHGAGR